MLKWFFSFIIYVNFKFNIEKIFVSLVDIICNIYIYVVKYSDICISIYINIFIFFYI